MMANVKEIKKKPLICSENQWTGFYMIRYERVNRKSNLLRVLTSDILYYNMSCIIEYHIQLKRKNYNQAELSFLIIFKVSDS